MQEMFFPFISAVSNRCNAFSSFAFLVGPTCVCRIAVYQRDESYKRRRRKLRLAAFRLLFGYRYRAAGLSRVPNWDWMWGGPTSKPSHSTSTASSQCSANNSAPKSQASKIASGAESRKSKSTRPTGSSAWRAQKMLCIIYLLSCRDYSPLTPEVWPSGWNPLGNLQSRYQRGMQRQSVREGWRPMFWRYNPPPSPLVAPGYPPK